MTMTISSNPVTAEEVEIAEGICRLARTADWVLLDRYLEKCAAMAEPLMAKPRGINESEISGYWKGVWQVFKDLRGAPGELRKALKPKHQEGKKNELETLD